MYSNGHILKTYPVSDCIEIPRISTILNILCDRNCISLPTNLIKVDRKHFAYTFVCICVNKFYGIIITCHVIL